MKIKSFLTFSLGLMFCFNVHSAPSASLETKVDKNLSVQTLTQTSQSTGSPSLKVAYYDTRQGFLAIYETAEGKKFSSVLN